MSKSRLSRLLPKFLRGDKSNKNTANVGNVDSKTPCCSIHFLDDSQHQIQIKGSWKGSQVLDKVCELLSLHEKDYFSLRYIDSDGQTHWLDTNKTLSSQFKGCQYPYRLYFGVKFYAADPCKLREEITRYLFFLQVKQDILQGRLPVTFDEAAELCAYAVQSELGDFDPRVHTPGYVSEFCFIQNQTEELEARIAAIHRRLGGLVPMLAEYRLLDKVKWLDMYGVDLHPVMGEGNVEYFLGLTPTGIVVYKNKNKVGNYFWPRINKVTFKGKIFIVKVKDKNNEEHAYAFELARKTACKHLWKCCVEHHAFFSGRSERQAVSDNLSRQSSSVIRLPSRRQPRRVNSDSGLNARDHYESQYHGDTGMVTMVMRPEPVRAPRHRSLPELQGRESPRSVKSAPWETKYDYGLYTMGKESPVSARSDRMSQQRSRLVSGSDSESGISQRRKYFPNRRGSDNDSDVSVTRRRRREVDSDSASDISSRYPASQGHERSNKSSYAVLYPFHDKENRPNGSIPSLHSAPAGEAKQRRRRRRSKSPGKRPPDELKQHFEYGLKDTLGMSEEQLREIPFVNVETKASLFKLKYSPKLRQKVKAAKQRSMGDLDQNRNQILRKEPSAPLQDNTERDMSVHSQPVGRRENYESRENSTGDQKVVSRSKSFTHRPHSYHQSHNHRNTTLPPPPPSTEPDGYLESRERDMTSNHSEHHYHQPHSYEHPPHSNSHERHDPDPKSNPPPPLPPLPTNDTTHYQGGSAAYLTSQSFHSNITSPHHNSRSDSESARKHHAASNSSRRSHRSHHHPSHRDSASYVRPRSQRAYESDNNSVVRSDNPHLRDIESARQTSRNDGTYSRNTTLERDSRAWDRDDRAKESDYERSVQRHQYSGSRLDGSRSGRTWEGQGQRDIPDAVSGYHYRERRSAYSAVPPSSSSSSHPHNASRTSQYWDNYSNPAPHHSQQPQQQPQQQQQQQRRTSNTFSPQSHSQSYTTNFNASYSHGNYYDPGQRSVSRRQGQRSHAPPNDERPALPPRSQYPGDSQQQNEHQAYRPASRLQYDGQQTQRYQHQDPPPPYTPTPQHQQQPHYREPPPQYHTTPPQDRKTPPRHQGTPPSHQGTPPRNQGTSTQNQGTPPRHLTTPPRRLGLGPSPGHQGDARYSHGLLSVHTREQSEGSSSQASAFGHNRSARPSPSVSDRSANRGRGGHPNADTASQFLRAPVYNPELCTEL